MVRYRIRVRGHLDRQWSAWFDAITVDHLPDGQSLLTTAEIDQAALHSILSRVLDLNLVLLSVDSQMTENPESLSNWDDPGDTRTTR